MAAFKVSFVIREMGVDAVFDVIRAGASSDPDGDGVTFALSSSTTAALSEFDLVLEPILLGSTFGDFLDSFLARSQTAFFGVRFWLTSLPERMMAQQANQSCIEQVKARRNGPKRGGTSRSSFWTDVARVANQEVSTHRMPRSLKPEARAPQRRTSSQVQNGVVGDPLGCAAAAH